MATTYNYIDRTSADYADYFGDATYKPAYLKNRLYVVQRTINLATAATDVGANLVQNDVLKVIDVPANTWVIALFARVTTTQSTLTDVDIGIDVTSPNTNTGDVDGFIDGMSFASAATSTSIANAGFGIGATGGKYFIVADTIDMLFIDSTFTCTGVVEITVLMMDCS
jgi:hypothetical protein